MEFLVRPEIPEPLSRMNELAHNVLWSWEPNIRLLFRRLDSNLWRDTLHNPVAMLGRVPQETLLARASDPRYLALYRRACERLDAYMRRAGPAHNDQLIAFFSMEYGLIECLHSYAGGLGILAGDFLKACSDLDVPIIGVGLLYQRGYLEQTLSPDGWQQERYPLNDFYSLPVSPARDLEGNEVVLSLQFPHGLCHFRAWQLSVGRVKIFFLDTNIPENEGSEYRNVTERLYVPEPQDRIRQEILLGIGGLRALKALRLRPTVFHMNEGHSAFLALERIRELTQEEGLTFEEALEATRNNNTFTTHTSLDAGIDRFETSLLSEYLADYCREGGIDFERVLALGRHDQHPNEFRMPALAMRTSAYKNAVSKLHQQVSQEMWQGLWPNLPTREVPVASITNGVHLLSWLNSDLAFLYDQYLQPDWRERFNDPAVWEAVADIPDHELWEAHRRRKLGLIAFLRERQRASAVNRKASKAEIDRAREVLDPNALTIGFARRFATYKRASLFRFDLERLQRILCHPDRPVQIIIGGKAHPRDEPGKRLIREVFQLARDPVFSKHIVFVEDYNVQVARFLVQGVDLWLNTPRRGQEACGTSGMKAGLNGVLNFSVLDGWFDEAYEVSGGWVLGDRDDYSEDQDPVHAQSLYSLLENEIVPAFYDRPDRGYPPEWMARMKQSLMNLSRLFDCRRMVEDYLNLLYTPAHQAYCRIREDNFRLAREKASWSSRVEQVWDKVRFVEVGPVPDGNVTAGRRVPVRSVVDLAGLQPEDVRVELVVGQVGPSGMLKATEVQLLPAVEQHGSMVVFGGEFQPRSTGRLGFAVRITPNHYTDPITRPSSAMLKWSEPSTVRS